VQGILLAATVELSNQNPHPVTGFEAALAGESLIHVMESLGPQNGECGVKLGERQIRLVTQQPSLARRIETNEERRPPRQSTRGPTDRSNE
jgi:hypothetical protein